MWGCSLRPRTPGRCAQMYHGAVIFAMEAGHIPKSTSHTEDTPQILNNNHCFIHIR